MKKNPDNHDAPAEYLISGENLQDFIELSPLPVYVVADDLELLLLNSAAADYLGAESSDLTGKKLGEIVRPEELERLRTLTSKPPEGKTPRGEWELQRADGSWVWAELTLRVLPSGSWLIFASDINDRRLKDKALARSAEQRFQTQKFEALGRLAGGIAHDFNNFLAVVLLQIDMLNLQLPADSPVRHRVNEIKEVSKNAAGIVRQLMAFGRRQPMNPSPVVLNPAIRSMSRMLETLVTDKIKLDYQLESALGVCFVDQNQVAQVLTNLAVNARAAMPDGGTITIKTDNITLAKADVRKNQSPGPYIQITFTDNGVGMDEATKDHIFEPFFSTRESDKGAGLGLASVYGTVKQMKGYIWVESEVGRGTTFDIQFPRVDQQAAEEPETETEDDMPGGSETILLVDDDSSVRRLTAGILEMSGYKVYQAARGVEAVEAAQSAAEPVHLLLTDLHMPEMDGLELMEKIHEICPEAAVLFMSGDTMEETSTASGDKTYFLGKPFTPSKLALKIREVLDS